MSFTVAVEQMTLTPSIREHLAHCVEKIEPHLAREGSMKAFVKKPTAGTFTVLFRVHAGHEEWIAEETADDFYAAANGARDKMVRLIEKAKSKRLAKKTTRRERAEGSVA